MQTHPTTICQRQPLAAGESRESARTQPVLHQVRCFGRGQDVIVAFDVVELLPMPGHHASDFLAAKLVYRVLAEIWAGSD